MKTSLFKKKTRFNVPVDELFAWHARPGALERLSPPWDPLDLICKSGGIEKNAVVAMKIRLSPLPFKRIWIAQHIKCEKNHLFQDRQISGPFAKWVHTHRFMADGEDASFLEDEIEYALPFSPITRFPGAYLIRKKLERIFHYRHFLTARDLEEHMAVDAGNQPLTILISGASGLVGSHLVPFLTTGGHRVIRLVRQKEAVAEDALFWDPRKGIFELDHEMPIDVVVHLAGENIGDGRWTKKKKQEIMESRDKTTALLAEKIRKLEKPPNVMINASAIGFYGNRGDEWMTEEDRCGPDFISGVCSRWEEAALPARENGIRTVFLRIGVVLSPKGGALKKLLPVFKTGLGGALGDGTQYMSWIHLDDVIRAIYHGIYEERLDGPVNVVAPEPVQNNEFASVLGRVLKRPSFFTVPKSIVRLVFGEMGKEVPLSSTRVVPGRLKETGFSFHYPDLEGALGALLGKNAQSG